jgi:hypothetical protein
MLEIQVLALNGHINVARLFELMKTSHDNNMDKLQIHVKI